MRRNYLLFVIFCVVFCAGAFLLYMTSTSDADSLLDSMEKYDTKKRIEKKAIEEIRSRIAKYADSHGRVTPDLQRALFAIEDRFSSRFSPDARAEYQCVVAEVGGKMRGSIQMPTNQVPFWLINSDSYKHYRSTPHLPKKADIVIVGAGLTGTSAAYHLSKKAPHKKIIVVEADRPAAQASGKNGGNFQLLAESYTKDTYEGMVEERSKILSLQKPTLKPEELRRLAEKEARILLEFSYHNSECFQQIIKEEKIECDFSPEGWLRIASSKKEENGLIRDIKWMNSMGMGLEKKIQLLTPKEIRSRFKLPASYYGRFITGSGNYHPYKFVVGLLKRAISNGVRFYSGVKVESISPPYHGKKVVLKTSDGIIECDKVIVATNAFTPALFKELDEIQCVPSLIMNLEHVPNHLNGITVTARGGDFYYNFPQCTNYTDKHGKRRGMLHLGLDDYAQVSREPAKLQRSKSIFKEMKAYTDRVFPSTSQQPPSRVWVGPMAFTQDRVPVIGFMHLAEAPQKEIKDIIIAAAFQGYGGSYCIQAGKVVAEMAVNAKAHAGVPVEMFSPKRFLQ